MTGIRGHYDADQSVYVLWPDFFTPFGSRMPDGKG